MENYAYELNYKSERDYFWFIGIRKIVSNLIKYFDLKDDLWADMGCGTGYFLYERSQKTKGVGIGIDYSKIGLSLAGNYQNINRINADIASLPINTNVLDGSYCINVIYHEGVKSEELALKEMNRVLKPAGWLILLVPAFSFLWNRHDDSVMTRKRYNINEINDLMENCGFRVKYISYIYSSLFPFLLMKAMFYKIFSKIESKYFGSPKKYQKSFQQPPWLVKIFSKLVLWEAKLIPEYKLPFGTSIVCLGYKEERGFEK